MRYALVADTAVELAYGKIDARVVVATYAPEYKVEEVAETTPLAFDTRIEFGEIPVRLIEGA